MQQIFGPSVEISRVLGVLFGAYVVGCVTTGYYLVKFRTGQDIRELGSGSVGAKNAGRILGVPGFCLTLLGDFFKGTAVVWLVYFWSRDDALAGVAMVGTVLGHIWPVQLRLHGGKGVATSLGALAFYDFKLGCLFVALTALLSIFGRVTLGGLLAFALLPLAARMMDRSPFEICVTALLAAMILLAHRRNIVDEFAHLSSPRDEESKPDESLK